MLDGLSVWGREVVRPRHEQSPTVIAHETERSRRMIDLWESEIADSWMHGGLNLEQITLACTLGLEARNPDFKWRAGHPRLLDWFEPIAARPSFVATAP
jgi:glutathione S-transferase